MEQAGSVEAGDDGFEDLVKLATVAVEAPATVAGQSASLGTGFFVAPDLVVTCAHVLADNAEALPDQVTATVVAAGRDLVLNTSVERFFRSPAGLDLAILRVAERAEHRSQEYVLMSPILEIGDDVWVHGHPDGRFRAGQPATFRYQGMSLKSAVDPIELPRLHGTPVGGGFSGSPVINRRTGAVCGMLCTANQSGSAHLLSIKVIFEHCEEAQRLHEAARLSHQAWLRRLNDRQLREGGWAFPGAQLRAYLSAAAVAAERHPYEQVLRTAATDRPRDAQSTGIPTRLPPLSEVYVYQMAAKQTPARPSTAPTFPISAAAIFDRDDDVFLIGEAGSGKSSLLRAAVVDSTRRWNRDDWDATVPVRISAADLLKPCPLPEAIAAGVNVELSAAGAAQSWPPEFFSRPPVPGVRWHVLVDGLDEVAEITDRQEIIDKVANFRRSGMAPDYRFIVATRPLPDVELQPSLGGQTSAFKLRPFTDQQLREFAELWFEHLQLPDPPRVAGDFARLVVEAGADSLFRIPLLAMMLCQLYAADQSRDFPATSVDLYNEFVSLLRERFYRHGGGIRGQIQKAVLPYGSRAEDAGEQLLGRVDELIGRLAWNRRHQVVEPAVDCVAQWTVSLRSNHVPVAAWKRLIREIFRRSGVLVEHDWDFEFLHQTIAEFVAANFVAADPKLSDQVFRQVLPSRQSDLPTARSYWRHPYARFLVFAWRDRPDLMPALRRVVDTGELDACRFVVELVVDGILLAPDVTALTLTRLRQLADPRRAGHQARLAIETAARLDLGVGWELLTGVARNGLAEAPFRRWAFVALAQLTERRAGLVGARSPRASVQVDHTTALRAIAVHGDVEGRDLLAHLAMDPTLEVVDRWTCARELELVGDSRATGLLNQLADDANRQPSELPAPGFGLGSVPTGRRVRARLARFNAPWQTPVESEVLEPLIATHRVSHPKADGRVLQRAFDVAARWHSGQYRRSGDPYVTHPLAVATILANLGMDTTTLVAALLHDTIVDTEYGLEQMRTDFGGEVALLVDGVTKLDRVKLGDAAQAETIRKMVVAMAKDPRVLLVKLACRLHDMRTLTFAPRHEQEQLAKETLEILAPLAHRLGVNVLQWELEDLAFGTLFPKRFEEINRLIGEHQPQREALLRQVTQKVQVDLKSAKIKAETTGRPKHLYSIYQKMIVRGRDFNDIYDLVGVRILVDTVRDCYAALGVIHANWQPVPGRFKDYIAMPKFNMYQSLHTTVIGPTGRPVEMQIRTFAMHRIAEFGIAAHWKYKEQAGAQGSRHGVPGATVVGPPPHIDEMTWLRQLLDWQRGASDPSEFLDALRFDLSSQEVYVFTPKGDVIPLPTGSTPVDFAYAVHTEVGHKCIGARVNGKLVPLESTLSNGDVIEIFTSKSATAGPTQDWLGFVKSPRARTKIRQYFNKERREEAIEIGKEAIVKAMRKQGLPLQRMLTSDNLMTIARDQHLADVASLYAAVGDNQVSAQSVVQKLVAGYGGEEGAVEDIAETAVATRPPRNRTTSQDPGVVVKDVTDVWVKLARCCTPVPGDTVFGFVTRSGGVSVHREDCANAEDLRVQGERVVEVSWKPTSASTFLVAIQVEALDRHKLLADVTRVLSEERVNILSATVTTTRDRVAVSRFSFEMADPKHLGHLLAAVRKVDGVFDAYRVTSGA